MSSFFRSLFTHKIVCKLKMISMIIFCLYITKVSIFGFEDENDVIIKFESYSRIGEKLLMYAITQCLLIIRLNV